MSQKTTENSEQLCISVNLGKTLKKPLKNSETPKYTSEKLWYSKNHWKLWTTLYLSKPLKNSEKPLKNSETQKFTSEKLWNSENLWKNYETYDPRQQEFQQILLLFTFKQMSRNIASDQLGSHL